jgi:hypothetical protein
VRNVAQALGLRPWLAALPLRERRLRARLLMSTPRVAMVNGPFGCGSANFRPVRGLSPLFLHSRQSGDYLAKGTITSKAIDIKSF